jgi:hypothetical protein
LSPLSIDDKDPESLARNAAKPTNSNQADPVASNQAAPAAKTTPTELSPHQSPAAEHFEQDSESAAAADTADASVELPTEQSPKEPPTVLLQQQRSNRQLQRVEILSSAGEWVGGYFVHRGIAVANLAGSEHRFKLFDALGSAYIFWADSPTSVRAKLNSTSATKSARPQTEPLVERPPTILVMLSICG